MRDRLRNRWLLGGLLALAIIAVFFNAPFKSANRTSYAQTRLQETTCNSLVEDALKLVAARCIDTGRNEACYGNNNISATLHDDALVFETPGDIVPVTAIDALITRAINPAEDEWGVAMLNVQADLPDDDDSVQILVFGGAEVTATAGDQIIENTTPCTFVNTSNRNLNLRAGPGDNYAIFDVLDADDELKVYGRSEDGDWLRSSRGWVYAADGDLDCDNSGSLQLINDIEDAYTAPMQSFTLRVDDAARCEAIPSGLLIQSPTGQTANLLVNNIEMRVGSTALVWVDKDGKYQTMVNLDGNVDIASIGVPLPEGSQITVPIGDQQGEIEGVKPVDENLPDFVEQLTNGLSGPNQENAFDPITAVLPWEPVSPTITFEASTLEIFRGECATLEWAVTDAKDVLLNGALVPENGSVEVCPAASRTYTLVGEALTDEVENSTATLRLVVIQPVTPTETPIVDTDGDAVADDVDNCPEIANQAQVDTDSDGQGDACDPDDDNDGVLDEVDNCPLLVGSVAGCPDSDGDGVRNEFDNCPNLANPSQTDTDSDGQGDACDPNDDNDTFPDPLDQCPLEVGTAQGCPDGDGDGIKDTIDNCPALSNPTQADLDGDGIGDACDTDLDGDGVDDTSDNCPGVANPIQEDDDEDGIGNACDPDDDEDGLVDTADNCPLVYNPDQDDTDADGQGDACDPDDDNDTVPDTSDSCPLVAGSPAAAGCPDGDNDTIPDGTDNCPAVPNPGQADNDSDGQGDICDLDDDNDGVIDALDNCPATYNPDQIDTDENGLGDACDPLADIAVDVAVSNPTPMPGEIVTVTFSVTNNGPSTAVVQISLTGSITNTWTVGTLGVGQTATLTPTMTAGTGTTETFTITVSPVTTPPDPNFANNSDTDGYTVP